MNFREENLSLLVLGTRLASIDATVFSNYWLAKNTEVTHFKLTMASKNGAITKVRREMYNRGEDNKLTYINKAYIMNFIEANGCKITV